MDNYKLLAKYYDQMKSFDNDKLSFFQSIFDKYDNPTILDCACGTGYDMEVLRKNGYNVIGSDISESMLSIAKERFKGQEDIIHKVSFEELHQYYTEKFDVILCLSNSINEIHVDPIKALKSMTTVLKEDGVIIITQGQSDASMKNPPTDVVIVDNEEFSRKFKMTYTDTIMKVDIEDTIKESNEVLDSTVDIVIRLQDDWIKILDECKLSYEMYGDLDGTMYDKEQSNRLIVVVTRTKQ